MAFLHESEVRARAREQARRAGVTAEALLQGVSRKRAAHYDIFLSQTIRDAEIVLGVYGLLTELGFTVFCDWIAEPDADRSAVTPAHAELIRSTMAISDTLLFLDTEAADQSLWMCWELGWFDGRKGLVGILPVLPDEARYYRGREFLGLYPYVELDEESKLKVVRPVVAGPGGVMMFEAPNSRNFESWRKDPRDFMRPRVITSRSFV